MAITLNAETNQIEPAQAGVFLEKPQTIYLADRDLQLQSRLFADINYDLIHQGVACILQAAITEQGELIDLNYRQNEDVVTLIFDCQAKDLDQYSWQITRANSQSRIIRQLDVNSGQRNGRRFWLDHQGSLRKEAVLDQTQIDDLSKEVLWLSGHELTRRKINELQAQKERVLRQLGLYAVEALMDNWPPSIERYEAEKSKLEKRIDDIGFSALKPYEPLRPTQINLA